MGPMMDAADNVDSIVDPGSYEKKLQVGSYHKDILIKEGHPLH